MHGSKQRAVVPALDDLIVFVHVPRTSGPRTSAVVPFGSHPPPLFIHFLYTKFVKLTDAGVISE
jgi:hypothetical protein